MLYAVQAAVLASLIHTAQAHVRAIPTGVACRNCNGAAAPGPFSVAGALSGSNQFGANTVNEVSEGQEVTLAIGYNGGHQSATLNFFTVRYACGTAANQQATFNKIGPTDKNTINCNPPCKQLTAAQISQVNGQPATAANYPVDATASSRDGYQVKFNIPKIEGTGDQRKCTFALVEGRNWGTGWDFNVAAAATGGVVTPPVTTPPPQTTTTSLSGTYTFTTANCIKDSPNCNCMSGSIKVNSKAESTTALISVTGYPDKIISLKKGTFGGAVVGQYILSNCNNQYDQLLDINLSPIGTTEGSLNVGVIDDNPFICGAIVKTTTEATILTAPAAIPICAGCQDVSGWVDNTNDACPEYKSCENGEWRTRNIQHYQQYQNQGLSSLDACCVCGGGQGRFGAPPPTTTTAGAGQGGNNGGTNNDGSRVNSMFGRSDPAAAIGVAAEAVLIVLAALFV